MAQSPPKIPVTSQTSVTGSKRKLSSAADHEEESKRCRTESAPEAADAVEPASDEVKASSKDPTPSGPKPDENKNEDKTGSDSEQIQNKFTIDGPGPHTFFLWGDYMAFRLFQVLEDSGNVWLKPAVLDAWSRISLSPDEERAEISSDHCDDVLTYTIYVADGAWKEERAKALADSWEDQKDDDAMTTDAHWWEIDVQRNKPEEGPALKVRSSWCTGAVWWATAVRLADETGEEAMVLMSDHLTPFD